MTLSITILYHYAECRYTERLYAKCRFVECRGALLFERFDSKVRPNKRFSFMLYVDCKYCLLVANALAYS